MKILAIDTTTVACSAALCIDGHVEVCYEEAPREHTRLILPMINTLLQQAGYPLSQLDALACTVGPGSFTGMRIGVGVVQGLAYGADLPVIPVSTLATLAQGAHRQYQEASHILAALDAQMGQLYVGQYHVNEEGIVTPLCEDALLSPEEVTDMERPYVGIGSGLDEYKDILPLSNMVQHIPNAHPHAQDILPIAQAQWKTGKFVYGGDVQPIYLRAWRGKKT